MVARKAYKILVVEPSRYLSKILRDRLAEVGIQPLVVNDLKLLLKGCAENSPDLVVTDLAYPTTFTQIERLRKTQKFSGLPIVAHTMIGTREKALYARRNGITDIITKPSSFETIIDRLTKHLGEGHTIPPIPDTTLWGRIKEKESPIERIQILLKEGFELKPLPQAVTKAISISNEEGSGAKDIANIVKADTVISASILKKANSAHYAGSRKFSDIGDAIVRIGFEETRKILLGMSLIKMFKEEGASLGFTRMGFWEHSLAVASFASLIASRSRKVDPAHAFVAGILHDVGKLIFDEALGKEFERAIEFAANNQTTIRRAEQEIFSFAHNEVGYAMMRIWKLPPPILQAVYHHNTPDLTSIKTDEETLALIRTVAISNSLAKAIGYRGAGDGIAIEVSNDDAAYMKLNMGITKDSIEAIHREVADFKTFLNIKADPKADMGFFESDLPELVLLDTGRKAISIPALCLESERIPFRLAQSAETMMEKVDPAKKIALIIDHAPEIPIEDLAAGLRKAAGNCRHSVVFLGTRDAAAQLDSLITCDDFFHLPKPLDLNELLNSILEIMLAGNSQEPAS